MSKLSRILFVTNNYTPYSGGVVSSIKAFSKELKHRGYDVFIITLDFLGKAHSDPNYVLRIGCPIKFLYKNNHMAIPINTYKNMKQLIEDIQPDIIHSHHPFLLGKVALKIASNYSIPLVFTHHTMYEQWSHVVPLPTKIMRPIIKAHVKRYCNNVNGIIAPSFTVKNYLQQQKINVPIQIIPSCLQTIFYPSKSFYLKPFPQNCCFHLLSVTRFSEEKNVAFLIDVLTNLILDKQPVNMTLIGYGPLWNSMQDYAYKQLCLTTKEIKFIHRPSREQIVNLYHNTHIFLFSSQTDTQGIVLTESMAAGTPIIALDGPGQRDIIQSGKNGFIVKDIREMCEKIKIITHDRKLYEKMQYIAWKTSQRYKAEQCTDQLLNFYKKVISQV